MKIRIHGDRSYRGITLIEIIPTAFPSDEDIISDAQKLYQVIRSTLPSRTYAIIREAIQRERQEGKGEEGFFEED